MAGVTVGTVTGPLKGALKDANTLTGAGSGVAALNLTEGDGLSADKAGWVEDLAGSLADSGEAVARVGEEEGLSVGIDARGGKHSWVRCSSTWWAGT